MASSMGFGVVPADRFLSVWCVDGLARRCYTPFLFGIHDALYAFSEFFERLALVD